MSEATNIMRLQGHALNISSNHVFINNISDK